MADDSYFDSLQKSFSDAADSLLSPTKADAEPAPPAPPPPADPKTGDEAKGAPAFALLPAVVAPCAIGVLGALALLKCTGETASTEGDLKYVYGALVVLSRCVAFVNFYPTIVWKTKVRGGVETLCLGEAKPRLVLCDVGVRKAPRPAEYPRGTPRRGRDPPSTTAPPPAVAGAAGFRRRPTTYARRRMIRAQLW